MCTCLVCHAACFLDSQAAAVPLLSSVGMCQSVEGDRPLVAFYMFFLPREDILLGEVVFSV